jgi:hypothetical protein
VAGVIQSKIWFRWGSVAEVLNAFLVFQRVCVTNLCADKTFSDACVGFKTNPKLLPEKSKRTGFPKKVTHMFKEQEIVLY